MKILLLSGQSRHLIELCSAIRLSPLISKIIHIKSIRHSKLEPEKQFAKIQISQQRIYNL